MARVVEMRIYRIKAGRREAFLDTFVTRSIPEHRRLGMEIIGPFPALNDPDAFFFMRGFPSLADVEPMKARFYEGELWKRELEALLMPAIDKYEAILIEEPEITLGGR